MISSMTGYGRGEASADGIRVSAEVRTLNNRFFDFSLRASRSLQNFENDLREFCRGRIQRGKFSLILAESRNAEAPGAARVDVVAAKRIAGELSALAADLGIKNGLSLDHLLTFPEILASSEDAAVSDLLLRLSREATDAALTDLMNMRAAEGAMLHKDMTARLIGIEEALVEIESRQADIPARALEKLRERIKRITIPQSYDDNRLEMELAILADRLDITEECVRLRGHLEAFRRTLDTPNGSAGKRLEFLLQEMHRESNTISSKTSNLEISHLSVRIREEIERLREQVQNIE